MTKTTVFLSRLLGLYCLIIAAIMLLDRDELVLTVPSLVHERPLMLVVGIMTLFAGLAMVLVHNVWSGGMLPVIVTIIGWLTLAKALLILLLSPMAPASAYVYPVHGGSLLYVDAAISAVLGAYLTYAGFRAPMTALKD